MWRGEGKHSQFFLGRGNSLALFVDALNVVGVLFILVIDLQFYLLGIPDKYCLRFAGGVLFFMLLSYNFTHVSCPAGQY